MEQKRRNGTDDVWAGRDSQARNVCTLALLVDHAHPCWCWAMMCQSVCVHYRTTTYLRSGDRCDVVVFRVFCARCVGCYCSYYPKKHALPSWSVLLPSYVHRSSSFVMAAWNCTAPGPPTPTRDDLPRCNAGPEWSREPRSRRQRTLYSRFSHGSHQQQ